MDKKFTKDIENSKTVFMDLESEKKDYTDPFNKDERNWINMYFIQEQLKTIKWVLIIIAIILFYYVVFK